MKKGLKTCNKTAVCQIVLHTCRRASLCSSAGEAWINRILIEFTSGIVYYGTSIPASVWESSRKSRSQHQTTTVICHVKLCASTACSCAALLLWNVAYNVVMHLLLHTLRRKGLQVFACILTNYYKRLLLQAAGWLLRLVASCVCWRIASVAALCVCVDATLGVKAITTQCGCRQYMLS